MRKLLVVAVSVLGLGLVALYADEVLDATISDPDVHQVVLDNPHVRVIEAMAAPGYKSPMHSHPPLLIVSLGTARARLTGADGKSQVLTLRPGGVFWVEGGTQHSWELLSGSLNVIAVEVKAAKAAAAKP
jgi:quercetin dioxygenase-like cupin family protein